MSDVSGLQPDGFVRLPVPTHVVNHRTAPRANAPEHDAVLPRVVQVHRTTQSRPSRTVRWPTFFSFTVQFSIPPRWGNRAEKQPRAKHGWRESNPRLRFWRPPSYHLTTPICCYTRRAASDFSERPLVPPSTGVLRSAPGLVQPLALVSADIRHGERADARDGRVSHDRSFPTEVSASGCWPDEDCTTPVNPRAHRDVPED